MFLKLDSHDVIFSPKTFFEIKLIKFQITYMLICLYWNPQITNPRYQVLFFMHFFQVLNLDRANDIKCDVWFCSSPTRFKWIQHLPFSSKLQLGKQSNVDNVYYYVTMHCFYVSNPTICIIRNPTNRVKMCNKEPKKVSDVKHNQSKLEIYFFITIWNHSNHGKLIFFPSYECQGT